MKTPSQELSDYLGSTRVRWQRLRLLRAWLVSAVAATTIVALALGADLLLQPRPPFAAVLWCVALGVALFCLLSAGRVFWLRPDDLHIARFVQERCPDLEDALVTAVHVREGSVSPLAGIVIADALRQLRSATGRQVVVPRALRRACVAALAATLVFVVALGLARGPATRGGRLAAFYLMPDRFGLRVWPGDARVAKGGSLQIEARVPLVAEGTTASVRIDDGERGRDVPMHFRDGRFELPIADIERTFSYSVVAAGVTSRQFTVAALNPPRVERVDAHYEYPALFKMPPRDEADTGDLYGPAGTRVRVSIHADKPLRSGQLTLSDGTSVPLTASGERLEGTLAISADRSYRIALSDTDGLTSPGDVEYFIRVLDDRPPDVRIVHPAVDRRTTPLEEVSIEARADDDFGVQSFELVYSVRGRAQRVVPFTRNGTGLSVTGTQTIFLEDLEVEPGDFVTYFARATDVSRGKPSTESRSDMFFLEVAPFDEEFVVSDAQASGGDQAVADMVEVQKQIITATWTLDRRISDTGGRPDADIKAIAKTQADLRRRTLSAAARAQRNADLRRRENGVRPPAGPIPLAESDDAIGRAADAMLKAEQQLNALRTSPAIPFEMVALNELMRADAEVRRRDIQPQQTAGRGGGDSRQQQDLSSLFDKELARQQETNYEQRTSNDGRGGQRQSGSALDKVRDLAERQEALNQEQDAGSTGSGSEAERRRQLERLMREQLELKQRADDLARQLAQQETSATGSSRGASQAAGQGSAAGSRRTLEQIAQDMQSAANELKQQDREDANARGEEALAGLRQLQQQLGAGQPRGQERLTDLQAEARQLADEQRQISRQREGQASAGGRPAFTGPGEQQRRLADRAARLEQSVRRLAEQTQPANDRRASAPLAQAAEELSRAQLQERMRAAVDPESAEQIAQALERTSERLGAAAEGESEATRRLSTELAKIRELRERLSALERDLSELSRTGNQTSDRGAEGNRKDDRAGGSEPWAEAKALVDELRKEQALGVSPEAGRFNPGRSAPGTEAWKQDLAQWETLKTQLRVALEKAEASAAVRLRGQRARDRLNAGASQAVPESYRRLVERYYRALAGRLQ